MCYKKYLVGLFMCTAPLFAQYNFNFVCNSDTFQTGTDYFVYYFRLTNTGTQPDSYAFDCRVIDSVPGWFELYCAGGQCAEPGIILYDYLTPGAVDTGIDISVYTATGVWGTEIINLKVWSLRNPNLKDSINVYAAMEQGICEGRLTNLPFKFEVHPNPFNKYLMIKFQIPNSNVGQGFLKEPMVLSEPEVNLAIYNTSGRLIKNLSRLAVSSGWSTILWYGDDNFNRKVPEGVYFIEVRNGENKIRRKVVRVQ